MEQSAQKSRSRETDRKYCQTRDSTPVTGARHNKQYQALGGRKQRQVPSHPGSVPLPSRPSRPAAARSMPLRGRTRYQVWIPSFDASPSCAFVRLAIAQRVHPWASCGKDIQITCCWKAASSDPSQECTKGSNSLTVSYLSFSSCNASATPSYSVIAKSHFSLSYSVFFLLYCNCFLFAPKTASNISEEDQFQNIFVPTPITPLGPPHHLSSFLPPP